MTSSTDKEIAESTTEDNNNKEEITTDVTVLSSAETEETKIENNEDELQNLGYRCTGKIGCHKFHPMPMNWDEARKVCRKDGGHLAIVDSQEEARVSCFFNFQKLTNICKTRLRVLDVYK